MSDGFEYRTEFFDFRSYFSGSHFNQKEFDHKLNELGWEGWELVNTFDTNWFDGDTQQIISVFKRKLTDERREEIIQKLKK